MNSNLMNIHCNNRNTTPIERMALLNPAKPPLARLETFEDDLPTNHNNKPSPKIPNNNGIDDGLLTPQPPKSDPDAEFLPKEPEIPDFGSRAGGGDGENEDPDVETIPMGPPSRRPSAPPSENGDRPGDVDDFDGRFPPSKHPFDVPNFDVEFGSHPEIDSSLPDVNVYQQKKTLAQGMMDLALFSANANQLRYVLESYERHPYFYPSLIMISLSLVFQVAVGVGLIWNGTYNVKDDKEICLANRINNLTVIGIFFVTVINVFISAFGVANPPK